MQNITYLLEKKETTNFVINIMKGSKFKPEL